MTLTTHPDPLAAEFIWDPATIKPSTITFPAPADPFPAVGFSRSPIIGISGYARTGKDTAAAALVELGWYLGKFSGPMKEAAYQANPQIVQNTITYRLANLVDAYGWERAKDEFTEVRPYLQRFGKAVRDVVDEDVWVDAALAKVPDGQPAVFVDCRYRNEADGIRARGGIVVRINRPGVGPAVGEDGEVHVSEIDLDEYDFDYVIDNDGTLEQLRERAIRAGVTARLQAGLSVL